MAFKRAREGWLLVDNQESPGISDAAAVAAGLPLGVGRRTFEAPTYTCSHCHAVVVLNPARTRQREYCSRCDHHICDQCSAIMALSGECVPFERIIDEVQAAASRLPLFPQADAAVAVSSKCPNCGAVLVKDEYRPLVHCQKCHNAGGHFSAGVVRQDFPV